MKLESNLINSTGLQWYNNNDNTYSHDTIIMLTNIIMNNIYGNLQ